MGEWKGESAMVGDRGGGGGGAGRGRGSTAVVGPYGMTYTKRDDGVLVEKEEDAGSDN